VSGNLGYDSDDARAVAIDVFLPAGVK